MKLSTWKLNFGLVRLFKEYQQEVSITIPEELYHQQGHKLQRSFRWKWEQWEQPNNNDFISGTNNNTSTIPSQQVGIQAFMSPFSGWFSSQTETCPNGRYSFKVNVHLLLMKPGIVDTVLVLTLTGTTDDKDKQMGQHYFMRIEAQSNPPEGVKCIEAGQIINARKRTVHSGGVQRVFHGGQGSVQLIELEQQELAMKCPNMNGSNIALLIQKEYYMKNFYRECTILGKLKHENIVSLYGACFDWPYICILEPFYSLGSLYDVLQDNEVHLPWPLRLRIALEIALGVDYLHRQEVYHRDLKSRNVVVVSLERNDATHVKLIDFGSAKDVSQDQTSPLTEGIIGSGYWMAPEVWQHKPFTKACDVYSYGIVLWELATRENNPFPQFDKKYLLLDAVLKGERPPLPSFSCNEKEEEQEDMIIRRFLGGLMQRCWAADPADRPSFADIIRDLQTFLSPSPIKE
ncbi:Mitogen-activated protein kinase kinase kinase MLT [Balamuthia mandrillaris]